MQTILGKHWHHITAQEVLTLLDTSEDGLDLFEVKHRQEHFGLNLLTPGKQKVPSLRFLQQFNNPLIYILLAASLVTILVKDLVDGLVILAVVLINAVIGYLPGGACRTGHPCPGADNDHRSHGAAGGQQAAHPTAALVPGDLILLEAGDKIPADMRLVHARDLRIGEVP